MDFSWLIYLKLNIQLAWNLEHRFMMNSLLPKKGFFTSISRIRPTGLQNFNVKLMDEPIFDSPSIGEDETIQEYGKNHMRVWLDHPILTPLHLQGRCWFYNAVKKALVELLSHYSPTTTHVIEESHLQNALILKYKHLNL